MTEIPDDVPAELVEIGVAAWRKSGRYFMAPCTRAVLAAVLPVHERMVRAQVAVEVEAEIKATRPHFADPDTAALYERLLRALTLVIADDTEDDIREAVTRALTGGEPR